MVLFYFTFCLFVFRKINVLFFSFMFLFFFFLFFFFSSYSSSSFQFSFPCYGSFANFATFFFLSFFFISFLLFIINHLLLLKSHYQCLSDHHNTKIAVDICVYQIMFFIQCLECKKCIFCLSLYHFLVFTVLRRRAEEFLCLRKCSGYCSVSFINHLLPNQTQ